ncbi:MAG: SprT family zinc-dependent metalloprotease [Bacilli bacterium]|nr:SprT family zinc-dependent metalloprotease [Bacilli bacterium]
MLESANPIMNDKYTIEIDEKIYGVKLVPKNIKRVIVKVDYNNNIALHYPFTCPKKQAISHLYRQKPWLEKVLRKNEINIRNMHVKEVIAGKKIWLFGNLYNIASAQKPNSFYIVDNTLYITGNPERIIDQVRKTLCEQIKQEFTRFADLFKNCSDKVAFVSFRKMRSRWGSCNAKTGKINLNSLLVHVPLICIRYVIIHEFVHFIYPNHSPDFYRLLESFYPDYKTAVKELKKYLFILRI